jgi:hypothetical protein
MIQFRPTLLALLTLTLLWMLFFWRLLTPNVADRVLFLKGDFTLHYFAFSDYQADRLLRGEFPLWNPYNHAGDTFVGNVQFVAFYPPRILAIALSSLLGGWSIEAYQLEVAWHYWLASVLMYLFLRCIFGSQGIALIGALMYAYSGYLTGYPMLQVGVIESAVWLPLVLVGVYLSITRDGWAIGGIGIAGGALAVSLLAGHPQTTVQIGYLALAYLIFTGWRAKLRWQGIIWRLALMGIIAGGLSAIQLLPALEFARLSYRLALLGYAEKAGGFTGSEFLGLLLPRLFGVWSPLYIGVAGVSLAFGALVRPKPEHIFWIATVGIGLLVSLGAGSIVYDLFYVAVPGFSLFRQQERMASLISFALVILAMYQLQRHLQAEQTENNRLSDLAAGFVILAYLLIGLVELMLPSPAPRAPLLVIPAMTAAGFIGWQRWQRANWRILPLLVLVVIDLFTVGTRSENFQPDRPENRVPLAEALSPLRVPDPQELRWRVDGAVGLQGYGTYFRIPDIYGTGPFWLNSIEQLRQIPVDRYWEVLSVRYVTLVDAPPENAPLNMTAMGQNPEGAYFNLFELSDPRPLAHLVYDYRHAEGSPEFARLIMADARVNLREMAVTLEPLPFELPVDRPEISRVDDFRVVTPEQFEMSVSTGADALLTFAIPRYPGWRAYVDGVEVGTVDVYAGLIGVPIRAGENQQVQLRFLPDSLLLGGLISGLTLLGVIGLTLFTIRRLR